jgi:hypothetical protein
MTGVDLDALHPDRVERQMIVAFADDGSLIVGARLSVHPNRRIVDASLSVVLDGWQRSLHVSGRAEADEIPTNVGPIRLAAGSGTSQLGVDEPQLSWAGSLRFEASSATIGEPRFRSSPGAIPGHDSATETQFGRLAGGLTIDGTVLGWPPEPLRAVRTTTAGIEGVDERPPGAPSHRLPQQLWSRVAIELTDPVVAVGDEDTSGVPRHLSTPRRRLVPRWATGTRWLAGATLELDPSTAVELTSLGRFAMRGLGFASPSWRPGAWHDEIAVGTEVWRVDALDPTDVHHLHSLHVVEATATGDGGVGIAEVLALGPHQPSGLTGFSDGFTPGD